MKIICSLLLIGVSLHASAQETKNEKWEKMKKNLPLITHSIGASFQKFDGLNSRVAGLPQYKSLKNQTATIGLGWLKEKNQLVSAAGVTVGSSMSGDHDKRSSTIHYFSLNADIGYDVLKSERLMLYPFAGLGFQGYQAIFYRDNSAVNFDDVLESPNVQQEISPVKFKNAFAVYRFGLGFSVNSAKCPMGIGVQAGYTGSFKTNNWRSNQGQTLANAPADNIGQVFVGLVLTSTPMFMHR